MDSQQENSVNNKSPEKSQNSILIKDSVEETDFGEILDSDEVVDSDISPDKVLEYYTVLSDLNADLNVLFSIFNETEDSKELSSIGFQLRFNGTPIQVIFIPDQPYNTVISEYSLLEDLVKSSNHPLLGGEFKEGMTQKEFDSIVDTTLNNLSSEQLSYILCSNRNLQLTLLEIHLSSLASNTSLPVQVNFRRLGLDFIGTSIVHHMYNEDIHLENMYNILSKVSALQDSYVGHIGATYLSGGITVPDDIQSFSKNVEPNTSNRKGIGYQ